MTPERRVITLLDMNFKAALPLVIGARQAEGDC